MNEKTENSKSHVYDNWKAITESDFVTLYIKTWFAFVSTLRELYPDSIKPYYQAAGDTPCLSAYKKRFCDDFYFLCNYPAVGTNILSVYRKGLTIACEKYPRFLIPDFFSINTAFKETYAEDFSSKGGYAGKLRLVIKHKEEGLVRIELICTDKLFQAKAHCGFVVLAFDEDYSEITVGIERYVENTKQVLTDTEITRLFYSTLFDRITNNLIGQLEEKQSAFPRKGNVNLIDTFSMIQAFCLRATDNLRQSCIDPGIKSDHKLLYQEPITGFIHNETPLTTTEEQKAYLWFISYAYRLRNALFHEIIDPLNSQWQYVFKNAYLALKQIVDSNILRLKHIDLLLDSARALFLNDFSEEPPFDLTPDEYRIRAMLNVTKTQLTKYNSTNACVHVWADLKVDSQNYAVEGDVKWDENHEKKSVKHVTFKPI